MTLIRRGLLAYYIFVALAWLTLKSTAAAPLHAGGQEEAPGQILVMLHLPPPHLRPNEAYAGAYGDSATLAALDRVARRVARRNSLRLIENWPMPLLGINCFLMQAEAGTPIGQTIERVSRERGVLWAQPMQSFTLHASPTRGDTLFQVQPSATAWRLADLHRLATGRGVTIAVVDSGIDVRHPDLTGQFAAVEDFIDGRPTSPEKHGTGIAGVIAAKRNNGIGIAGIAPAARVMALRACREASNGGPAVCTSLSLARALHYAIERRADVINLSLSGPPDPLLERLLAVALRRNRAVVTAYDPRLPAGGFPSTQRGVIAVGDASLSTLPPNVYGAPARDIPTTQPGGTWHLVSGSSYAAAHVSGLMALARERGRRARPVRSSDGAVDACATLVRTRPSCDCPCASFDAGHR